jgi:hypothetical protein
VVNPTGSIGLIGVYFAGDPGGADEHSRRGEYMVPLGQLWEHLRDMILAGRARPSFIVSQGLPLSKAPAFRESRGREGPGLYQGGGPYRAPAKGVRAFSMRPCCFSVM